MTEKTFRRLNIITGLTVLLIASVTYLLTIEPTVSFWDCGEFIASSYRLEVGHPPGNPTFQILARLFTIFTDPMHAAAAINALSAVCSALTVFFLYLTIIFFAKRLVKGYDRAKAIQILAAGAVGSLAYCFSDTFWFSAVEAEVYAMSSLFTAFSFWAMTRWYEEADKPHSARWIVLISFVMGLSIGVHLLNLLTIPAIVFIYFYKVRDKYSPLQLAGIFMVSCVILAAILFVIVPFIPRLAAYTDLLFVNGLGLPFNSGAATFMILLYAGLFYGLFRSFRRGKALANTVLLCLTVLITGFSLYSMVIIRASVNPPMNENNPNNPFTLISYLNRDQFPKGPIVFGEWYGADYDVVEKEYWTRIGDKYIKGSVAEAGYAKEDIMFFPRMWDNREDSYVDVYESYIGASGRKPSFIDNLTFFFDYQMNWMYWRYFLWNFAGRQNDLHSPMPGDRLQGNWESGIGFIDRIRLGDQSDIPDYLSENKAKNHYYMLPLLLGLIGMFYHNSRDPRDCWLNFLMFFMTGIAIVLYLNQSPLQVRERDYAYAGSFCYFSVWIGLGALAISQWLRRSWVAVLCLGVPALMAAENWDDHDRSNRYTAQELGRNYINGVGRNGMLVTHGDNDTFPIWYVQEVEDFRTDVRVINTSLLGADWHIGQMKTASNESAPVALKVGERQYMQGENELVFIYDTRDSVYPLADVMKVFRHPEAKLQLSDGQYVDYIVSRRFSIPVNKENVIRYGILDEKFMDLIPEEIILTIPEEKNFITKPELFFLDLLSEYEWDRPLHFLSAGGDINIGIKDYLMYDCFTWRFIPIKNKTTIMEPDFTDPDELYRKMKEVYSWDSLARTDWFVDYQNIYTFTHSASQRRIFTTVAMELIYAGENEKAIEILDMCQEAVPEENFPLDLSKYGLSNERDVALMIEAYYLAGAEAKADELWERFTENL